MISASIASGKGGTGKTTLAVNLADYMANEAKFKKVVLADLDVEEPNSGIFIDGSRIKSETRYKMVPRWNKEKCNACGRCHDVCRFNAIINLASNVIIMPELCHSCYACSELCPEGALPMVPDRIGELVFMENGPLKFIEGRLDVGQEQAVPLISQGVERMREEYSGPGTTEALVIIDSPPGTSCPVIEAAKNSDFVILVTEPTPFGLHDLSLAVETMREIKKDFAVVINRFGIGNDDVLNYCKENNIDVIAKIPNMRQIAELYSNGLMIYREVPEFKVELERISLYLSEISRRKAL